MGIIGGILIAVCAASIGVIIGGMLSGWKVKDLEIQVCAKRSAWCRDCRFKLDAAGFDEQLLTERRSKYACLREKEKECAKLRRQLYEATLAHGVDFLGQNVARV